jgi:hypothetical protein
MTQPKTDYTCEHDSITKEEDYDYAYVINPADGKLTLLLDDQPVDMIIDSGASCNIINSNVAQKLRRQGLELTACSRKIYPYGSAPLTAKQSVHASVQIAGKPSVNAEFLIIPGSAPPILGKATAEALGILKIGVHHLQHDILDRYPGIADGIGKLKDFEVPLHIDKSIPPVARKHSRIPFHLRDKVAAEIQRLEQQDVIEKVSGPTEWVSRIVAAPKPRSPNEIRVCVDMRDANKAIVRTRHVTPTLEELVADMSEAKVFSKLDLTSGYHQLVLKPESRYITTFSTHCGLYQYKRLSFGINSAAEIFQHAIQTVIADIKGARNVSDDIIIFGKDTADHDRALHEVLQRLHDSGLTLNRQKCKFRQPQVEFYGFIFTADGLKPDPAKVRTLHEATKPTNATELRSFLGMAQYSARFIEGFATLTEPLRQLTKQDSAWSWGELQDTAFMKIKNALCESATLAYFDINKHIELLVDASPVGVAALLSQEGRTVCYASRSLSDVEQRYSQTEREALAVVWACEHFDIYVRGTKFTVITDHRPLLNIWDKPFPPARIARWALRLQPYQYVMKYKPGKDNPADYLSRHPGQEMKSSRQERIAEDYIHFIASNAITIEQLQDATTADPTLQAVMKMVQSGRWHEQTDLKKDTFIAFRNVRDSLCVNADQNILLKGTQLVIPSSLQQEVLELAHEGHQGINKSKALLRSKVWFPGMDAAMELVVRNCIPCQANSNCRNHEPLNMSELPRGPWLNLSMDFCGPLPTGESLLVITDEYSRYPVVEIMNCTSAEKLIPVVDKVFSTFGYPETLKTDNGPQFISNSWKNFMNSCGIKHRRITPLWPKANAQAESFNKPLMKSIRAAHVEKRSWKQELHKFCRAYRTTPHSTTCFTPYYLLFNRDPKTKFPEVPISSPPHPADAALRSRDTTAKLKMKQASDRRHHAKSVPISPGDSVLVKQVKHNKLSTNFHPVPLTVMRTKGSMVTARFPEGSTVTRNSSLFRRLPSPVVTPPVTTIPDIDDDSPGPSLLSPTGSPPVSDLQSDADFPVDTLPASPGQHPAFHDVPLSSSPSRPQPGLRHSTRTAGRPLRFKDYVCASVDV